MDPGVRAARDQQARERLLAAAEALAAQHGLDDQLLALQTARTGANGRHPLLGPLFQQEAAADFLEGLLAASAPGAPGAPGLPASPKPPGGPAETEERTAPKETKESEDVKAAVQAPEKAPPRRAEPAPEAKPEPAKAVPRRGYPAVPAAPEKSPEAPREKPAPGGGERR